MTMEFMKMPVISTGHLTAETRRRLTAEGNDNPWTACAQWPYGYFIFVDVEDLGDGVVPVPADIQALADWWRKHEATGRFDNSRWIRLDRDGEIVDDLRLTTGNDL